MPIRIVQIDAFTDRAFSGNPAGVCLLDDEQDEGWMQLVAREMNLAETAFLRRRGDDFELRWFTPTVEVDLCGHATLASAHFLWQDGILEETATARFTTRSGLLTATRHGRWIELDFPADPPEVATPPKELIAALGVNPVWSGRGMFDWIFRLGSEADVRDLAPDLGAIQRFADRGVIVTAASSGGEADFVSRFFGPAVGVPEDPVTGSAHCTLAPYWAIELGREALTGFQASERGGWVRVETKGDRVLLAGRAVTVMRIELTAEPGRARSESDQGEGGE